MALLAPSSRPPAMPFAIRPILCCAALVLVALSATPPLRAQSFSLADVLSPGYPTSLVSAQTADRIAWLENERGMRNVYTASGPAFEPVKLTVWMEDNGHDLTTLQISDDGSVVAFLRGHTPNREGWIANPGSDPRGAERAVWAMSTDGGEPWRVVEAWNFSLSPDGDWVAYERDGAIYRAPVNPGLIPPEAADAQPPLFSVYGDQGAPVWSPDSRKMAFVSARGGHSYIGVYDLDDPSVMYLTPGVDRDFAPVWSADSKEIAFIRRPGAPFGSWADLGDATAEELPDGMTRSRFQGGHDFSIWIADAETGAGSELWHNSPEDELMREVRSLLWASDQLLFQAEFDGWRHYYAVSTMNPTPEPTLLTPGDGIAEQIGLSADGSTLFYSTNAGDIDRRHLWRVPVAGGDAIQLTSGDGIETYPAPVASGRHVAVLAAGAKLPQSVAVVPAGGGSPRVIRALPERFPFDAQVAPEAVTLSAEDGFEFYNQVFVPPDLQPGERRPALIFIHGGSRRQMLLGYHYRHFYHMAYAVNQYFANKGYVVLSVNYRSGVGYGREFRTAPGPFGTGNDEYLDVLAAGRYLQTRDDVDPERVGLWGLSYGGVLTAQGLARNSDVFAAGVDIAGVHLWSNSLDPDDESYRSSAISEVASWTSPVLLIHADDDRNVEFSQTVGLVAALRAYDVPHELIVFPDDVHSFLIHERWLQSFRASDDFFDRTLIRREPIATGGRDE